jgi:hypothetical protein
MVKHPPHDAFGVLCVPGRFHPSGVRQRLIGPRELGNRWPAERCTGRGFWALLLTPSGQHLVLQGARSVRRPSGSSGLPRAPPSSRSPLPRSWLPSRSPLLTPAGRCHPSPSPMECCSCGLTAGSIFLATDLRDCRCSSDLHPCRHDVRLSACCHDRYRRWCAPSWHRCRWVPSTCWGSPGAEVDQSNSVSGGRWHIDLRISGEMDGSFVVRPPHRLGSKGNAGTSPRIR